MLTYALGRGLEAYDVQAVDTIVGRIEKGEGRASALIAGIIESAPFQKRRRSSAVRSGRTLGPGRRSSESTQRRPDKDPTMTQDSTRTPRNARPAPAAAISSAGWVLHRAAGVRVAGHAPGCSPPMGPAAWPRPPRARRCGRPSSTSPTAPSRPPGGRAARGPISS